MVIACFIRFFCYSSPFLNRIFSDLNSLTEPVVSHFRVISLLVWSQCVRALCSTYKCESCVSWIHTTQAWWKSLQNRRLSKSRIDNLLFKIFSGNIIYLRQKMKILDFLTFWMSETYQKIIPRQDLTPLYSSWHTFNMTWKLQLQSGSRRLVDILQSILREPPCIVLLYCILWQRTLLESRRIFSLKQSRLSHTTYSNFFNLIHINCHS